MSATSTRSDPSADSAADPAAPPVLAPGRRELVLAWIVALLFAAVPFRAALLSGDHVVFAVDTATTQLPWSAALPADAPRAPVNPDLSDQGIVFYPFHRWVSASWRAGDPPSWCPLIYAGAPGYGNAQAGAFDPQVWFLVALDALGGKAWFDHGHSLLAWLRVAAGLAGAFALARRLGLGRPGSTLTAISFGAGGFLTLWLNHPLGHVAPYLPWLLFFLEGARGPRALRSAAAAGACLLGAILGGHVETAFFVGAAGGLWALALAFDGWRERAAASTRDPRAPRPAPFRPAILALAALALGGLGGAVVLLPVLEYLDLSAAKAVREASAAAGAHAPDLLALGAVLVLVALFAFARRTLSAPSPDGAPRANVWLPVGLGLAGAVLGVVLVLLRRDFGLIASLALVPDRLGAPGAALPYSGASNYIEAASAWVPFGVLVLALAACVGRPGPLRRRGLVLGTGVVAFLLAVELPGLLDAYRFLPLVGLGATVRLAVVSSLFLGLLAGEALEHSSRSQRVTGVLVLLPLVALGLRDQVPHALPDTLPRTPESDELLEFVRLPAPVVDGVDSPFECWVHPGVPLDGVRLRLRALDADGAPSSEGEVFLPLEVHGAPSHDARNARPDAVQRAPDDARWLRTPYLLTSQLDTGNWRVDLEGGEAAPWSRRAAVFGVRRSVLRSGSTLACIGAVGLLLCLGAGPLAAPVAAAVLLLALLQSALFARGVNPVLPRAMVFEETATERVLAAELGVHRFQADPGVLPADTGLVRGLRHVEGYDAMDPKAFNDYRSLFLPPGLSPLLAWNARAVDHDDPVYRLLGVKLVAMREPWSHPRFELVASPEGAGDAYAETWIYRDTQPLPRAFVVPEVATLDEIGAVYRADPQAWDPLQSASVESDWRPERPFTTSTVGEPVFTNATVRVDVELDGDGLLVLTDQHFPGWEVRVNGEPRELLVADVIFRGVALEAGRHEVEFRYRPPSMRIASVVSIAALAGLLALGVAGLRRPDPTQW